MIFVFFDYRRNNAYGIGEMPQATRPQSVFSGQTPSVRVSGNGVTVLFLPSDFLQHEKVLLALKLDQALKAEFGKGADALVSAASDCCQPYEASALFKDVSAKLENIMTIWVGHPDPDITPHHEIKAPDVSANIIRQLLEFLSPQLKDTLEPREGWGAFEGKITELYNAALLTMDKNAEPPIPATGSHLRYFHPTGVP